LADPKYELDIIASDHDVVDFVSVKAQTINKDQQWAEGMT
jgi:Holliday junction resolvase-like predicted endonuclease